MEITCVETLSLVNEILKEVVPAKVAEEVTLDTSLNEDLAINSIETMDILIKMREKLSQAHHMNEEDFDTDKVFGFLSQCGNGDSITVRSLCNLIEECEAELNKTKERYAEV